MVSRLCRQTALMMVALTLLVACQTPPPVYRAVTTERFEPILTQWRERHPQGVDQPLPDDAIVQVADNMLLMQRNNGGWPEPTHPFRRLNDDQRLAYLQNQNAADATLTHGNTFAQIYYLSHVYLQTGDVRYRDAAKKAFRLVLQAQHYNGGWTRRARVATTASRDPVTIDTGVTVNALAFLRRVAAGQMPYGYIGFDERREAAAAVRKGDELLLRSQQAYDSRASLWAGAYRLETGAPAALPGASEPALDVTASVAALEYLMELERPAGPVRRAVEGAVAWLERNTLQQWQLRSAEQRNSRRWLSDYAQINLPDRPVWARWYDIERSTPQVQHRRSAWRVGAPWFMGSGEPTLEYGSWARELIEVAYPAWRERWERPSGVPNF